MKEERISDCCGASIFYKFNWFDPSTPICEACKNKCKPVFLTPEQRQQKLTELVYKRMHEGYLECALCRRQSGIKYKEYTDKGEVIKGITLIKQDDGTYLCTRCNEGKKTNDVQG